MSLPTWRARAGVDVIPDWDSADDPAPYVVTARLDGSLQRCLDDLREAHFPPARNYLAAHLTLLHAVPAACHAALVAAVTGACTRRPCFEISVPGPMGLGRGVALRARAAALDAVHGELRRALWHDLGAQDRAPLGGHVTVANKIEPAAARRLLGELRRSWVPRVGQVVGLSLWRYRGGPWQLDRHVPFCGALSEVRVDRGE